MRPTFPSAAGARRGEEPGDGCVQDRRAEPIDSYADESGKIGVGVPRPRHHLCGRDADRRRRKKGGMMGRRLETEDAPRDTEERR